MRDFTTIVFGLCLLTLFGWVAIESGENHAKQQYNIKIQNSEENEEYAKSYIKEKLLHKLYGNNLEENIFIWIVDAKISTENEDIINITYFQHIKADDINENTYEYKFIQMSFKELDVDETTEKLLRNNLQQEEN